MMLKHKAAQYIHYFKESITRKLYWGKLEIFTVKVIILKEFSDCRELRINQSESLLIHIDSKWIIQY